MSSQAFWLFSKKVKHWKLFWKSVTIVFEKIEKLKHDLKKRYDPSRKKSKKLKNVFKKCYGLSWKIWKTEKCPSKGPPKKKKEKLKKVLKKRYDPIGT